MCNHFLPMRSTLCVYVSVAMNLPPWTAYCKLCSAGAERNVCFVRRHCKGSSLSLEKAKNSDWKCRCDWQRTLQKWMLYLGGLLCKHKALDWIEPSLEKQERKYRLRWGNSPFSKHRGIVTGHASSATFDFQPSSIQPRSLPLDKVGGQSVTKRKKMM